MNILHAIGYGDTYMPFLSIFIFIFLWKYINKHDKYLLVYVIVSFILFGISNIIGAYTKNNLPLYHVYSLLELVLISNYILKLIAKKSFALVYFIICLSYFLFWICNIIFFEPLTVFNGNSAVLATLIILFLSMYYLLSLSGHEEILHFQKLPAFWIVSGFLIYAALSLLVFISYGYINVEATKSEADQVWMINIIALFIKYILMWAGLLCYKRNSSSQISLQSFFLL